jgi:hypothetical protein
MSNALSTNKMYDLSQERGLLIDNGATRTLTKSLMKMSNVRQETAPIQLAGDGISMKSTNSSDKTCYAVDSAGTIRPITTKAPRTRFISWKGTYHVKKTDDNGRRSIDLKNFPSHE